MATERIIGIDFGTSTTAVRVKLYRDGRADPGSAERVTFNNENDLVPTLVQTVKGGKSAYFGYDAAVHRSRDAQISENFKLRLMSADAGEREEAEALTREFFGYLGHIYAHQRDTGCFDGPADVERTIVSYPVKWSEAARNFMIEAAKSAGFPNVTGMDEAQAAVSAVAARIGGDMLAGNYFASEQPLTILLIDMGAGTTDLVLCRYARDAQDQLQILRTWPEDATLTFGGCEVDAILRRHIVSAFPGDDAVAGAIAKLPLKSYKAWKENNVSPALARGEAVNYFEALNSIADILGIDPDFPAIDRASFEAMAAEYLGKLPQLVNGCLHKSGVDGDEVDLVILTGGHSQWYFVRDMLAGKEEMERFGAISLGKIRREPGRIISLAKPEETVSLGLVLSPLLQRPAAAPARPQAEPQEEPKEKPEEKPEEELEEKLEKEEEPEEEPEDEPEREVPASVNDSLRRARNYFYGEHGVPQNFAEAVKHYRIAAEQGSADAMYALGLCSLQGLGVRTDLKEALKWFTASTELDNAQAKEKLRALVPNAASGPGRTSYPGDDWARRIGKATNQALVRVVRNKRLMGSGRVFVVSIDRKKYYLRNGESMYIFISANAPHDITPGNKNIFNDGDDLSSNVTYEVMLKAGDIFSFDITIPNESYQYSGSGSVRCKI